MGWFSLLWDAIKDALASLLRAIVTPIVEAFTALLNEAKYWKHQAVKLLAKWMKTDLGFIAIMATIVVVAIYLPKLIELWTKLMQSAIVTKIVAAVKAEVLAIVNIKIAIDLKMLSDMLKIVWPEWKTMTDQVNALIAAWAEELGQGSGFIHSYFAAAYAMSYSTVLITGIDPRLAGIEWYERARKETKRIDDKFKKYAHAPETLFTDLIDSWLIPMAEEGTELRNSELAVQRERWERVLAVEASVIEAKQSIDRFVEELPEEIRAEFNKRWESFSASFDEAVKHLQYYLVDRVNNILAVLAEREGRLDRLEEAVWRNMKSPLALIASSGDWSPEEQNLWAEFIYASVLQKRGEEQAEGVPEAIDETESALKALDRELAKIKGTPIMSYESPGIALMAETAGARKDDWFVGEY